MLQEEEKGTAAAFRATASSADAMDVVVRVIGRVVLDDPVDFRKVQASLRDIRAEQNALISLAKLKIGARSLLLLLLSMDVLNGYVHVVEQVRVELHCVAARHEHHDLLLEVLAQESEEELEFAAGVD